MGRPSQDTDTDYLFSCEILGTPDLIFYNGKVVTVDSEFSIQQAFAVKGERFVAVGTNNVVKRMAGKNTLLTDLKGATVIPGMSDSHDHLFNACRFLWRGINMVGVSSLSEMQDRLKMAIGCSMPGQAVYTTLGWNIKPKPTCKDLDKIASNVPIVLVEHRRGRAVYNTAALKAAGVSKEKPEFAGMPVPQNTAGEFTGESPGYPASMHMLNSIIPPMSLAEEEALIVRGLKKRNALGITSIRELSVWPEVIQAYSRVWRQKKLTVRVGLGLEFPEAEKTGQFLKLMGVSVPFGDPWLRLDSTGEEPWPPGTMASNDYVDLMRLVNRLGWRPCPHVSIDLHRGLSFDETTDHTLAAYEKADLVDSIKNKRWYIEHVPFSTPRQISSMAKLGLIVSIQDNGYHPLPPYYPKDKARLDHQNPVRSFLDNDIVVIGGSDYRGPSGEEMNPNNPLIPFYFYVTRRTRDGDLCAPKEKISRQEALRIFTSNAAYATFEEDIKGAIEPGKLADFVILSQDLMTVPDDMILETKPLATFVGGKKVYSQPNSQF